MRFYGDVHTIDYYQSLLAFFVLLPHHCESLVQVLSILFISVCLHALVMTTKQMLWLKKPVARDAIASYNIYMRLLFL
jgi:hypothetical protein